MHNQRTENEATTAQNAPVSLQSALSQRTQLELSRVYYRAGESTLLRDLNASLSATGVTAVMGFNGAGKSVLLKVMHGILTDRKSVV